jgi:hypothetical protein
MDCLLALCPDVVGRREGEKRRAVPRYKGSTPIYEWKLELPITSPKPQLSVQSLGTKVSI